MKDKNPYIGKIKNTGAQVVKVRPANKDENTKVKELTACVRKRRSK